MPKTFLKSGLRYKASPLVVPCGVWKSTMIAPIVATVESWQRFSTQICRGVNYLRNMSKALSVIMAFVYKRDYFRNLSLAASHWVTESSLDIGFLFAEIRRLPSPVAGQRGRVDDWNSGGNDVRTCFVWCRVQERRLRLRNNRGGVPHQSQATR